MQILQKPKIRKGIVKSILGNSFPLIASVHHGMEDLSPFYISSYLNLEELMLFSACSYQNRLIHSNKFYYNKLNPDNFNKYVNFIYNNSVDEIYKKFIEMKIKVFNYSSPINSGGFNEFKSGKDWFYKMSNTYDKKIKDKYNFYEFGTISDRLNQISNSEIFSFKKKLIDQVGHYVFDSKYKESKIKRKNDNHNLKIMNFQAVYPKSRDVQIDRYSSEIAKLINLFEVYKINK